MSESDVCRRQTLTYKDDPRAEKIKTFMMTVDPYHRYSNGAKITYICLFGDQTFANLYV